MEIKAVDKHNEKMDGMNQSFINGKSQRFFRKDQEKEEGAKEVKGEKKKGQKEQADPTSSARRVQWGTPGR